MRGRIMERNRKNKGRRTGIKWKYQNEEQRKIKIVGREGEER